MTFVQRHVLPRRIPDGKLPPAVLVKWDIEGAEYHVMEHVLSSPHSGQVVCALGTGYVEWHPHMAKQYGFSEARIAELQRRWAQVARKQRCVAGLQEMDDETYYLDKAPLPPLTGRAPWSAL